MTLLKGSIKGPPVVCTPRRKTFPYARRRLTYEEGEVSTYPLSS